MKDFFEKNWSKLREKLQPGLAWLDAKTSPVLTPLRQRTNRALRPLIIRYRWYRRSHPVLARVGLYGGGSAMLGLFSILFFVALVYVGVFGRLPNEADLRNLDQNIASEVFSADSVLLGKYFVENRLPSEIEDISPFITNALVATEDARFFDHGGIDLRAGMRVVFRTLLQGDESSGGGSTLSQQLAKNLFPRNTYGPLTMPVAKIKEMLIARRLENIYSKEQLLALYLNKVPFGERAFGIQVAAKRFFATTPSEIKVEEAAVLIGMLKATTAYNPRKHPERALERRNVVLAQMVKYGKLDSIAYDSIKQLPIELKYSPESHVEGIATYFRETLRLELEEILKDQLKPDGTPYNLYTDGLRIYTTIDSKMQSYAEDAVKQQMSSLQTTFQKHFKGYPDVLPWGNDELLERAKKASERYKTWKKEGLDDAVIDSLFQDTVEMTIFTWENEAFEKDTLMTPLDSVKHYLLLLRTGFLAAEPQSGKVLAWVGGINFKNFKYDHVRSTRQVGSTFKPIVYTQALRQGIPPCEMMQNRLVKYENDYEPRNSDGAYGGQYSMAGALYNSVNVVAVAMLKRLGIDNVKNLASEMGITAKLPRELGLALGSADVSLYEMVQAFGTYPNRGTVPELYYLDRIETASGDTLFAPKIADPKNFKRVLPTQHADIMNHMMQMVVDKGTGRRLRFQCNFPYPAAGKTGTTNNNSDGWFIGYTPTLVFGAWVGAAQPTVRWRSTGQGQGGATALPICGYFLQKVYKDDHFKHLRRKVFAPLDELALEELDCPDFISPDSLLVDSIQTIMADQSLNQNVLIQVIRDAFQKKGPGEPDGDSHQTDPEKEQEHIRKEEEKQKKKEERQEKRQDLLDKIRGKDKKGGG